MSLKSTPIDFCLTRTVHYEFAREKKTLFRLQFVIKVYNLLAVVVTGGKMKKRTKCETREIIEMNVNEKNVTFHESHFSPSNLKPFEIHRDILTDYE